MTLTPTERLFLRLPLILIEKKDTCSCMMGGMLPRSPDGNFHLDSCSQKVAFAELDAIRAEALLELSR